MKKDAGWMHEYIVEPLLVETIPSAYPLVRLSAPHVGFAAWRRLAKAAIDGRGRGSRGILLARPARRPYICGMVWYRCEFDLARGKLLQASNLVAVDLLDQHNISASLILALGPLAKQHGCTRVRLNLPESGMDFSHISHALGRVQPAVAFEHRLELAFAP